MTGIDISNAAVTRAGKKVGSMKNMKGAASFIVMNAEDLQFESESYDAVIGSAILHHLDLNKALAEIHRVLKPGGAGIFLEPLGHNPIINLYRRLTPSLRTRDEHPLLMKDLFHAQSLFQVHFSYFHLLTLVAFPFYRTNYFSFILNTLEKIEAAILEGFPLVRKISWTILMELMKPPVSVSKISE